MNSSKKTHLDDLAIFGGEPSFPHPLHVGRPSIGNRERFLTRVNALLDSRWLSNNGPFVQEFERRIADALAVNHCIVTCNATVALQIAVHALDLSGEVIVPAFTFVATPHALRWMGLTPVFCDIKFDDCTIDPRRAEALITPHTSAILGVHLWGRPCQVDDLNRLADKYNLKLLFDAAHAFGSSAHGRPIGSFGAAEIFSFHATKVVNAFEGGAITTNDADLAVKLRLLRNFGFAGYDDVIQVGINGKMSEIAAAMGLTSLESMEEFVAANFRNYKQYQRELAGIPGLELLPYEEKEKRNYQHITLTIDAQLAGITRDDLCAVLWAENALVRRYFYPGCHRAEPYRRDSRYADLELPNTDWFSSRSLSMPTGITIDASTISALCQIVHFVAANGPEIAGRISRNPPRQRGLPVQALD